MLDMLPTLDFESRLLGEENYHEDTRTPNDGAYRSNNNSSNSSNSNSNGPVSRPKSAGPSQVAVTDAQTSLRSTKPTTFQESRNFWKKTIATQQGQATTTAGSQTTLPRRSHHMGCNKRSMSTDSTISGHTNSSDGDRETTAVAHIFCKPSSIPVWPSLRQARHRHSTPTLRSSHIKSPKRKVSTRIVSTPESGMSPMRASMPRRVQSRGKLPFFRNSDAISQTSRDLAGVAENEILVKMEVEVYEEVAKPGEATSLERNSSIPSIWNDPTEQHNFTASWRDHQDGHTTKDAFLGKLDFEASGEHKLMEPGKRGTLMKALDLSPTKSIASTSKGLTSKSPSIAAPVPPTRRSSKDKGIHEAKPLHITRFRSRNELQGISEHQAWEEHVDDARCPGASSRSQQSGANGLRKNTRSVESLSQIEAMILPKPQGQPEPATRPKSPTRKSPKRPRRPSKTLQPAGHPPERPLPELPTSTEVSKKASRRSASSLKAAERNTSDASNIGASPMSVSTVEASSPTTPNDDTALPIVLHDTDVKGLSIDLPTKANNTPSTPRLTALEETTFSGDDSPTARIHSRQKKKKASTDRVERVRELKRKHLAAMAASRAASSPEGGEEANRVRKSRDSAAATCVSRATQTTNLYQNAAVMTLSPPPPPPPPPSKYHSTFSTPTKSKRDTVDELDQFPAVPLSRPGSRASVAPTIQSAKGVARANSSPRKSRSRGRTTQVRQSLNHETKHAGQQPLSQSVIYINVDTDPTNSTFRASTISRSPSRSRRTPRASSPRKMTVEPTATGFDNRIMYSPKSLLIQKKPSSRSLRSQSSIARNAARHNLERVSPVSASRPGSRHNPGLLSSDEDSGHDDFIPKRVSSARPGSKSSNKSRASRKRKESAIPNLPMTGQFAMEHVLMALAKCQNQGLDISLLSSVDVEKLAHQQKIEDELDTRAAKRLSLVQRPPRPFSGRFDDQSRLLKVKMKLPRPRSDLSILTVTGTDTDASAHIMSDGYSSSVGKRGSAGSLTDPTDVEIYDLKAVIQPAVSQGSSENSRLVRTRRRPSSPTLSTKSFSYYQPTIAKRASRMLMAPPVAPPRTTSRMQTDPVSSCASLASKNESEKPSATNNELVDLDETATSDPFMLEMLDGMATWSHPTVNEHVWRTWGNQDRVIEGKALFTPPSTAMTEVYVT